MRNYIIGYVCLITGVLSAILLALFGSRPAHFGIIIPLSFILILFGIGYIVAKWMDEY